MNRGLLGIVGIVLCCSPYAQVDSSVAGLLEARERAMRGNLLVYEAQIKETLDPKELQAALSSLAEVAKSVGGQMEQDSATHHTKITYQYETDYAFCIGKDGVIAVDFRTKGPVQGIRRQDSALAEEHRKQVYLSDVAVLYEAQKPHQSAPQGVILRKTAEVFRYTRPAWAILDPSQRLLLPPDFAFLSAANPLYVYWGDASDWRLREKGAQFTILEREGEIPGARGQRGKVVLWLSNAHGYAPFRIEFWNGNDSHPVEREVPKIIWQARDYRSIKGVWIPTRVDFSLYWKPRKGANGEPYSLGSEKHAIYRLKVISVCRDSALNFPSDTVVADFRLDRANLDIGGMQKGVAYKWGDFGRLATEAELQRLYAEQYPEPPRPPWWRTALMYAPPFLLILGGAYWLYRRKRLQRFGNEP